MTEATSASGPSRRRFLGVALGAAGVAAAGTAGFGVARATEPLWLKSQLYLIAANEGWTQNLN